MVDMVSSRRVPTTRAGHRTLHVVGVLAIHDVFPDPADGGRPPYEDIYLPAMNSGLFTEVGVEGSLRILVRN
jgi:hypothetical protein